MDALRDWFQSLDHVFLGNPLWRWLLALLLCVLTFAVMASLRRVVNSRLDSWRRLDHPALELPAMLLANTRRIVVLILAPYILQQTLLLPERVNALFNLIIVFGIAIQVAVWLTTVLRFYIRRRHGLDEWGDSGDRSQVGVLMFIGQLLIWAVVALMALDNLGVNITALVAGLGIGGVAIALSLQTILSDLFASLSISFDKPFVVGETVRVDDIEGQVESIGIKSTRLRSVSGEQVIISNADMLKSRVRNMGRMPERRIVSRLRVAYESPADVGQQVPKLAEEVVKGLPDVRFVSCLLMELGVYALEFELGYFVPNLEPLMIPRTTSTINGQIFRRFSEAGIRFAYPTQRQLTATPAEAAPGAPPRAPAG